MDHTTFVKIVDQKKISQFEILDQQIPNIASDDFLSLFQIWKHFKNKSENTTQCEINNENQDIIKDQEKTINQKLKGHERTR